MKDVTRQIPQQIDCRNTVRGFTLIELMFVLAIGAVILTLGVPSFITTVKNNRLATETNKLVADINMARSEAIKRGVKVALCQSDDPSAATPVCSNSTTWTSGWLVFVDLGGTANDYDDGTDALIRVGLAAQGDVGFVGTADTLTYTSNGLNDAAATVAVAVCDDRGGNIGRQIQVNSTGRPRLIYGDTVTPVSCTTPAAM